MSIIATHSLRSQCLSSTPSLCFARPRSCIRKLHQQVSAKSIPSPTPFVPDAKTFLSLIGRKLSQHAAKIPSWESLFTLTSAQFRELGIEPPRARRYLLWWRDRFRRGIYGIGGDLQNVVDGTADLRVVEVPARKVSIRPPQTRPRLQPTHKLVVNVSPDTLMNPENAQEIKAVRGMKVEGMHKIVGLHIQHVKGSGESVAKIKVKEGMWEQKQGRKVDGGERRKVQVRYKRRMEQKRAAKR